MQKLQVKCECPSDSKETVASLMGKIGAGAQELQRPLDSKPSDFLSRSFFHTKPCGGCKGKGSVIVANGPDDSDMIACGGCNGTGE